MKSMSGLERQGLVHLYTGDGKGKTTAAAGLAIRALGAGKSVLFCQFLKDAGASCELSGLETLGARLLNAGCGGKFIFQMDDGELELIKREHNGCIDEIKRSVMSGEAEIVVLDEIVDSVNAGLITEDCLLALVNGRPDGVEIIMTGRNPKAGIVNAADYHTDFTALKHPYKNGVAARRGIEY